MTHPLRGRPEPLEVLPFFCTRKKGEAGFDGLSPNGFGGLDP